MKKVLALILAAAVTATVVSGCNNGGSASSADGSSAAPESSSAGESSKAPSDEDISANLRVLYPGTTDIEKEVANDLKKAAEDKYPNMKIEYIFLSWTDLDAKLLVMDQANDYPDVTQINEVENAARAGALEPIKPYLESSDILSIDNFDPVGLEYKTYDGVLYGVPHVLCTYAHIYNKDLCDAAGVDSLQLSYILMNQQLRQPFPGQIVEILSNRHRGQGRVHGLLFQGAPQQGLFHLGAVPAAKIIAVDFTAGHPALSDPQLKLQLAASGNPGLLFYVVFRRLAVIPFPGIVPRALDLPNPVQILWGELVRRRRFAAEHLVRQQAPEFL